MGQRRHHRNRQQHRQHKPPLHLRRHFALLLPGQHRCFLQGGIKLLHQLLRGNQLGAGFVAAGARQRRWIRDGDGDGGGDKVRRSQRGVCGGVCGVLCGHKSGHWRCWCCWRRGLQALRHLGKLAAVTVQARGHAAGNVAGGSGTGRHTVNGRGRQQAQGFFGVVQRCRPSGLRLR